MAGQPATLIAPEPEGATFAARMAAGVALFVLLGVTLIQIYRVGALDDARAKTFAYTQDEAYQHLVVGRELVAGTTYSGPAHFKGATPLAASASPGWSTVMAFLLGLPSFSREQGRDLDEIALVPLVVNIVAAALLIAVAGHLVSREIRSGLWMFLFLVTLGVLVSLPLMVMTGMEHLAHMVVILLAAAVGLRSIDRLDASVLLILLAAVLAAFSVALRYESLAVIVALLLWAWVQRHAGRMVLPLIAAAGMLAAVGAYLARHGASIVPNPVLVYAGTLVSGSWSAWPGDVFEHALGNLWGPMLPWVLLLVGAALLVASRSRMHSSDPLERRHVGWLFVFVVTGVAHLLVGPADGQSLRHTAYLIPLGAVAVARSLGALQRTGWLPLAQPARAGLGQTERAAVMASGIRPSTRGNGLIAIACALPLIIVAVPEIRGFVTVPDAVRDAFIRERVTASFVRTFWADGPVATNETGLLGYETNAQLVDLSGRANHELARARWGGEYAPERVGQQVAQTEAQIVLLLGEARDVPIPDTWKPVGGWHRQGTDRVSDSSVRVFSVQPNLERDVWATLRLFSEQPREGIDFWFVEDGSVPSSTQPGAVPWSEVSRPSSLRAS